MAAARIAAARFAFVDEPAPPETLDVVRRQRQLLRRAAALCLDPIAEETDDMMDAQAPCRTCVSSSAGRPWASNAGGAALSLRV